MKWYFEVLKKYAVFSGRARRSEYWYFALFSTIISFILELIAATSGATVIPTIYSLIVFLPGLAVGVRRMHDVNKSGWFFLIPIYNLILLFTEGTTGSNDYGSDPKRPEFDEFLQEPLEAAEAVR